MYFIQWNEKNIGAIMTTIGLLYLRWLFSLLLPCDDFFYKTITWFDELFIVRIDDFGKLQLVFWYFMLLNLLRIVAFSQYSNPRNSRDSEIIVLVLDVVDVVSCDMRHLWFYVFAKFYCLVNFVTVVFENLNCLAFSPCSK